MIEIAAANHLLIASRAFLTPFLAIDVKALQSNIEKGARLASNAGKRCRPHAKTHKCLGIARRQIELGAVGICCQKLSEAEIFASSGISDIIITNEVVSSRKIAMLCELAANTVSLAVCVDDLSNLAALSREAADRNIVLGVYIEVDLGQNRCGVAAVEGCIELARYAKASSSVTYRGLHAFDGTGQHIQDLDSRMERADNATERVAMFRQALARRALSPPIITGGGTGTLSTECKCGTLDEVQPGSYVFMDGQYAANGRNKGEAPEFEHSLFVAAEVISRQERRIVLDSGVKSISFDGGRTSIVGINARLVSSSDEHAVFMVDEGERLPKLGERLLVIPSHCDPTVNLHDSFVVIGDDGDCELWKVDARGAVR